MSDRELELIRSATAIILAQRTNDDELNGNNFTLIEASKYMERQFNRDKDDA